MYIKHQKIKVHERFRQTQSWILKKFNTFLIDTGFAYRRRRKYVSRPTPDRKDGRGEGVYPLHRLLRGVRLWGPAGRGPLRPTELGWTPLSGAVLHGWL